MNKLPFFNYKVTNANAGAIDLFIDGDIVDASTEAIYREWYNDDSATSFKKIRDQIDAANVQTVNVYVNSGGGQVTEAMAIHDYFIALQNKGISVNTFGRGIIASAATYILMAGKNSTISENSFFMIHEVSGWTYGTVTECENQLNVLKKFNETIAKFYSNATDKSLEDVLQLMTNETWYTGTEAAENGFVKNVEASLELTNAIDKKNWLFTNTDVLDKYNNNLKQFKNFKEMKFDPKKLSNAIKNAVDSALNELGVNKPADDKATTAFNNLATTIEAEIAALNDSVENAISEAVTNATKDLPTTVSNAVADALKNYAKTDDLKDFVTNEALKDLATTEALTEIENELEEVKNSIGNGIKPANKKKSDGDKKDNRFDIDGIGFSNGTVSTKE